MAITTSGKINNSADSRSSRYTQGGVVDRYSKRLGWWERRVIAKSYDDLQVTVQPREAGRPDLIAYRLYGKANLAWLILQFNSIIDPETELRPGTVLLAPTPQRVLMGIVTQPTGGNEIK